MKRPPSSLIDPTTLTPEQYDEILAGQIPLDPLTTALPFGQGHYRPSATQARFHKSQAYYSLVLGGGRTGKTTSCLVDLAWCLRGIHPFKPWQGPFTALAFSISRQQSSMVSGRMLLEHCGLRAVVTGADGKPAYPEIGQQPLIPEWEIADIGSVKIGFRAVHWVKLTNGCELWFSWSGVEDTWKRIQGPKIGYVYIDENAGDRKLLIESRKRLQDSQHPGSWHGRLVWGGHGTEDNDAFTEFRTLCENHHPYHEMFHLQPGETGAVTAEATERFASVLTEEERKIHITAESSAGDLVRVFRNQWKDSLVLPSDRVVSPDDNLWIGYDPGVDHPMGMLAIAIGREAPTTLTAVWARIRQGGTIEDDVRDLAAWLDGRRVAGFVYDTNLKNRDRGGGPSVLSQMKEMLVVKGVDIIGWYQSKKNHAPGINLLRQMMLSRRILVNPSPESGCLALVSQIKKYKGRESTRFTGEGGVIKKDDELMDDLRYVAMASPSWNRDWACGVRRSVMAASLDDDLPMEVVERNSRQARQLELSAAAGRLRQARGGAGRMRAMRAELWTTRAPDGGTAPVPPWQRGG